MSEAAAVVEETAPDTLAGSYLNATDRCDRCASQAYVCVGKEEVFLLFCNHHFNEHALRLVADGWAIFQDDREKLKVKP